MVSPKVTVDLTGPFFQRDPGKTLYQNIGKMLEGVAAEGERAVRSVYPVHSGAGRAGVVGRVHSLSGKRWVLHAVISQTHVYPWPGGGMKQYRGGKTEARHHMFRNTASALRRSRAVVTANFTAGMD